MVQDDEHLAVPNPPSVTAKAAPEEAPKEKATPQVEIDPHEDVVLAQLAALEGSPHHLKEGERFSRLSDAGKRYLANLAVARWHDETVERKQYFIADDNRLTEGKLPTSYVMRFARHYLKRNSNIDIIEASARVWVQSLDEPPKPRTEPAKLSEFRPTIIDVKRQLINDPKFGRALAVTRDYIAKMVIAEWESIDPENQPIFVSISDRPETGILPQRFIRFFRKKTLKDIRPLDRRASLYHDLKHQMPELATSPFRLINKRLEQIVRLWYWLPNSIRQSFTGVANREQGRRVKWVPPYFAEYLFKFISISTAARLPIKISKEPWVFQDEPQLTYQEFSLSRVMERIACMTETLRFYPSLLKARSKAVIDAWLLLDRAVRAEFVAADDTHEMISKLELDQGIDALPRAFVNFIHEFSTGVGILPRSDIVLEKAPDDDDGTSGPGGTGSGNIPSSQPPSIPSADMAAIHPGKSEVENTTLAPFAPSFTAYVGPMRHHGVVLPSMSAITMGVPANVNSFVQSGNMLMLGKIHAVDGGMLHQPTPMISPVIRMVGIR